MDKPLHKYVGETLTEELRAEMETRFGPIQVVMPGGQLNPAQPGVAVKVNAGLVILDTTVV